MNRSGIFFVSGNRTRMRLHEPATPKVLLLLLLNFKRQPKCQKSCQPFPETEPEQLWHGVC